MEFGSKYNDFINIINKALDETIVEKNTPDRTLYSAMRYSLMAGGKRLRPVLALAVCEMLGGDLDEVLPFACAIEMIHTYSLIHDDLPAMDNDDYRRGRLTNHKVYGEAMAILAGDALLNFAFETMLKHSLASKGKLREKIEAMNFVARSAGCMGMIGGQTVDLEAEGRIISGELLEYMHKCKTGALIKAPVIAAAHICGADAKSLACLEKYAEKIGLAFQIKDDILDIEGSLEDMGKLSGSDAVKGKSTFITIYGVEESRKMLNDITQQAIDGIKYFGSKADFLLALSSYLLGRKN